MPGNKNQYMGKYDLETTRAVDALYVPSRQYPGNPLIEALPSEMRADEITVFYNRRISVPTEKELREMDAYDKIEDIYMLEDLRLPLPFIQDLELSFHGSLCRSYSKRVFMQDENASIRQFIKNKETSVSRKLVIRNESDAPAGFALLGPSGCGKTTCLNMMLSHYPQVIYHNKGTANQFIQIVYLVVNCRTHSNFSSLFKAIGKAIDKALGNLVPVYEARIGTIKTLGERVSYVTSLVETFCIGMIIFDEVELIDLTTTSEHSIETLMTMTNESGVAISVVGTEEVYEQLFSKRRTARRTGKIIHADPNPDDRETFDIIASVFCNYHWTSVKINVTPEVLTALHDVTGGFISDLAQICKHIQYALIFNPDIKEVTPEVIRKIGEKHFGGLMKLNKAYERKSRAHHLSFDEIKRLNTYTDQTESAQNETDVRKSLKSDHLKALLKLENNVILNVTNLTNGKYTRDQIERAAIKVISETSDEDISLATATDMTIQTLEDRGKQKIEREKKAKRRKANIEKAKQELREDMNV